MIELNKLNFRWHPGASILINIPEFTIKAGENVFLEGPSGCGKTTLLNILSGIIIPETGFVKINGVELTQINSAARDKFRADHIGIIFQMFNLIPYLSPIENVSLPCKFSRKRSKVARTNSDNVKAEARRLLAQMKLSADTIINSPAYELSMGQQQRVAAARSLIGAPPLIVADEPTSALDRKVRQTFMNLLFDEVAASGSTLLFVSHDPDLGERFDRRVTFSEINKRTPR